MAVYQRARGGGRWAGRAGKMGLRDLNRVTGGVRDGRDGGASQGDVTHAYGKPAAAGVSQTGRESVNAR